MNEFITRTVYSTTPVTVEYALTAYGSSLNKIIGEMREWGMAHRERIFAKDKAETSKEV